MKISERSTEKLIFHQLAGYQEYPGTINKDGSKEVIDSTVVGGGGVYNLGWTKTDAKGKLTRNGDTTTVMTFNQFDGIGGTGLLGALHFVNAPPLAAA